MGLPFLFKNKIRESAPTAKWNQNVIWASSTYNLCHLNKQPPEVFCKKGVPAQVFSYVICKIFKNICERQPLSQLCTATPISPFVQSQISFRLLPSSVATFILIEIFYVNLQTIASVTDKGYSGRTVNRMRRFAQFGAICTI